MAPRLRRFTQSDASRLFKAAVKAGVDVSLEFRLDGTIIATIGKPSQPNGDSEETGGPVAASSKNEVAITSAGPKADALDRELVEFEERHGQG